MVTSADGINRKFGRIPRVSTVTGIFVGMVDGLARVNVQGATVDLKCDGWYPPLPAMPVRVDTVDGVMRVTGPSQALSPRGEVTESLDGGVRARVTVDGGEYVLPVVAPYAPVVTDTVVINWTSGHVLGEEAAAPDVSAPDPTPTPSKTFTNLLVYPTGSGKWDTNWNNWWGGSEVWASNNNVGIWVYGGRFNALAGATVTRAEIYLPLIQQLGACSIGVHDHPAIPGGAPTVYSTTGLPYRNGWVSIPAAWGNYLRDNPNSGIGVVSGSGLNKWRGTTQDALSGVIRFAGTR